MLPPSSRNLCICTYALQTGQSPSYISSTSANGSSACFLGLYVLFFVYLFIIYSRGSSQWLRSLKLPRLRIIKVGNRTPFWGAAAAFWPPFVLAIQMASHGCYTGKRSAAFMINRSER